MPQTPKKLTPEMAAAVEHWRWVEDQLHPLPLVTEPENTAMWEQQLWAEAVGINERKRAEDRYIERMRRIERNRIIDKLLAEANQYAQRQHDRRQRIIDRLLRDALAGNLPLEVKFVWIDEDDGRAEVVLGSPDGTLFVIMRDAAGTWADGNEVGPFSPNDTFENFAVIGQWFSLGLAFGSALNASRVVTFARGCDLGFLKRQFKLVDDVIQRFRLCTKSMPAQVGQLQLEFFDQQITRLELGRLPGNLCITLNQELLQLGIVQVSMGSGDRHHRTYTLLGSLHESALSVRHLKQIMNYRTDSSV